MKKNVVVFSTVLALSISAITAQENAGGKKDEAAATKAGATGGHKFLSPDQLQWGEAPPGLPTGAQLAVLEGNPEKKGPFTVRLKMPDGYKIAPHTHPTTERVTVISGTANLGAGEKFDEAAGQQLAPGGFAVLPAGMKHFAWANGETVVQINSEGPFKIKYVNPADDPRHAKQ
ncbi:MAG TPA: cupin domain-containing protein [Chthoniobacterales bacterium]|nr:cupin domain-containing protein [Chthoniobacterales bacterium]